MIKKPKSVAQREKMKEQYETIVLEVLKSLLTNMDRYIELENKYTYKENAYGYAVDEAMEIAGVLIDELGSVIYE